MVSKFSQSYPKVVEVANHKMTVRDLITYLSSLKDKDKYIVIEDPTGSSYVSGMAIYDVKEDGCEDVYGIELSSPLMIDEELKEESEFEKDVYEVHSAISNSLNRFFDAIDEEDYSTK